MADTVQYHMENMIPELEHYQQTNIFTSAEVRQIVSKRREFEYALKRVPARKIDGLRYIEFELGLDTLRQARASSNHPKEDEDDEKQTGTTKSKFDQAIQQRVHMLFNRLLRKFHGDLSLWVQYIDFCRRVAPKVLTKVFARCVQLHPRSDAIWIESAKFEFEQNGNIDTARVLFHRALRLNPTCSSIWFEYLRLECLFIRKLKGRRQVLGLPQDEALDQDKQSIFDGAIPSVVVTNAIEAIPSDVSFRFDLLAIVADEYPKIADQIIETVERDFPNDPLALFRSATVVVHPTDDGFSRVIEKLHVSMEKAPTTIMLTYCIEWLEEKVHHHPLAVKELHEIYDRYDDSLLLDETLWLKRIDFYLRRFGIEKAMELIQRCLDTKRFGSSEELHLLKMELTLRRSGSSLETIDAQFRSSLAKTNTNVRLWLRYTEWILSSYPTLDFVHSKLNTNVNIPIECGLMYMRFCFLTCGIQRARDVYLSWLKTRPLLPTQADTFQLLKECVAMEKIGGDQTSCMHVFERFVDLYPTNPQIWSDYIDWCESNQEFQRANTIRWRAQKYMEQQVA